MACCPEHACANGGCCLLDSSAGTSSCVAAGTPCGSGITSTCSAGACGLWIVWWSRRFLRASLRGSQLRGLWRNRRALLRCGYQLDAHLQSMAHLPKAGRHLLDLRRLRGSRTRVLSRRSLQDRHMPKRRQLFRLAYCHHFSRSTTSNTSPKMARPFFAVASSMVSAGCRRKLAL